MNRKKGDLENSILKHDASIRPAPEWDTKVIKQRGEHNCPPPL